jgi:hypothetical protein
MPLRQFGFVLILTATASAQTIIGPDSLAEARRAFERSGPPLRCDVANTHPALTYRLRFQAGYQIHIPLVQFHQSGDTLHTLLRVTPDAGQPVYLTQTENLAAGLPDAHSWAELSGAFLVGEGAYSVDARVEDNSGRVCRVKWRVQTRRNGSERDLQPGASPATVSDLANVRGVDPTGPKIPRLAIMLHAASPSASAAKMRDENIAMLLDSLTSVLEQMPTASVSLTVFNLQQESVLLRKDGFKAADLDEVRSVLSHLDLALVDYKKLQTQPGPGDMLSNLVRDAVRSPAPPAAVIFMGPKTSAAVARYEALDLPRELPPLFYLQFWSAPLRFGMGGPAGGMGRGGRGRMQPPLQDGGPTTIEPISTPSLPDGIGVWIGRLKGDTLAITNPHELADAIRHLSPRIPVVSVRPEVAHAPEARGSEPPPPTRHSVAVGSASDFAGPIAPVHPEPPPPTGADPTDVLVRLRDQVLRHAVRIPNHTCVETVQRDRYSPAAGSSPKSCDAVMARRKLSSVLRHETTDRLRLDVKLTTDREIYSWAGAGKFEEGEIDELIPEGAMGTGPFAAMLLGIFELHDPHFVFETETMLDGRAVMEYSFTVPRDISHYRVKALTEWLVTGYTGTLSVDPRTADLVRMTIRTDELPAESNMCETQTTLRYGIVPLGGVDYLLPTATTQRFIGREGSESENTLRFSDCREYRGESSVTFGDLRPPGEFDPAHPPNPLDIAPGVPLTIEILTAISADRSAAGDRIQGRLTGALRDPRSKQTVLPAGTSVEGRLIRTEVRHASPPDFTLVLRWETVEIDGVKKPLNLLPNRAAGRLAVNEPQRLIHRGIEIELPRPGEDHYGVYHFPGEHATIESGFRTEWLTR